MPLPTTKPSVAPIHDFQRKLLQPGQWGKVRDYVLWQRAVRAAEGQGATAPPMPDCGPISINLDLTTACNYACDHCIDWEALNLGIGHEEEELRDSLRNLRHRGLQSVILLGGGEPTLYPGFSSFVRFLKELGLQVAVVTNGSRNLQIAKVASFFTEGDWVRLSLDAGCDETFQAMHHPKGKGISLAEICQTAGEIKKGNPAIQLGYSFVITWHGSQGDAGIQVVENLHEMAAAAALAKASGFDYISLKPFLSRAEAGAEVLNPSQAAYDQKRLRQAMQDGLDAAKKLEDENFRVIESTNLRVFLDGSWQQYTQQPRVCHMQAFRQVVSPLGVYNCPAHRGLSKARVGEKNAWAGQEALLGTMKILREFNASQECKEVTCLYHAANHFLESVIRSSDPVEELLPQLTETLDSFL